MGAVAEFSMGFGDARKWAGLMRQAPEIVEEEMIQGTDNVVMQGVAWAKEKMEANGSVRTGETLRTIQAETTRFAGGSAIGSFGTNAISAIALEKGRRGFGPVRKKALAFSPRFAGPVMGGRMNIRKRAIINADGSFARDQKRGGGNYTGLVVVKRVGPAKAQPFMQPTALRLQPEIVKEFEAVRTRIVKRLVR